MWVVGMTSVDHGCGESGSFARSVWIVVMVSVNRRYSEC